MEETTTVHLTTEELILQTVQNLDSKVDDLQKGQIAIQKDLATHEERSRNQATRIERVEKAGAAFALTLVAALLGVFLSGCSLFAGLTPPPAVVAEAPKVDVVARAVNNSLALATVAGEVFCSAVAAEGAIFTAHHCIQDGEAFQVWYKGTLFPGAVVTEVEDRDLAVIAAVGARLQDTVPLATKMPVLGNKVIWTGWPLGLHFMMGTGIVGNPSVAPEGLGPGPWLSIYGQFVSGNSGGPIFNTKGELIGIVSNTATWSGAPVDMGYAVPLDVLQATLQPNTASR